MKDRDRTRAHLRDDIEGPGIGLFVDPRAQVSADNAYALAKASESSRLTPDDEGWLREALLDAARHFWADRDYDKRTSAIDMRPEIVAVRNALKKAGETIDQLSVDARAMLRAAMDRKTRGSGGDPVENIQDQITTFLAVCEPTAAARGQKGPREKGAVARCCSRLWDIREKMTGRKFAKTFTPALNEVGSATSRFNGPDAQFVLAIMQAMDKDNVTFSQVQDGLRKHAASLSKGK